MTIPNPQARGDKPEPLDHLLSIPIWTGHNAVLKRAARSDHRSVSAFVRLMILSKLHELGYLDEDFGIKDPDIEETVPDGLPAVKAS